ncbi:hypothetical protein [Pseudomonas sp. 5P_3.1_Bac2]|uniref:hypothetical protein n=1 Tax=Pseudomonas sp. 5P_3.1_Bac2 TaxID=2971617 RepID=UPI0021C689E0|nr:hypothetical protein [Pseudomonas sp. 5P_3.1_Bac2]MCU1717770.1 hypothetical protein [Pseudomonas sp. 5P_3.1_Bac2]
MQITPSAFNSGLSALQSGQRQVDQAASAIAASSLSGGNPVTAAAQPATPATASQSSASPSADRPSLSESLLALRVGQHEAQAGAKLVKTADEALGTLIDTRA